MSNKSLMTTEDRLLSKRHFVTMTLALLIHPPLPNGPHRITYILYI